MRVTIEDPCYKSKFISLFHLIKGCTSIINIIFNDDHIYIQGMDKSHVCLFNVRISSEWFITYDIQKGKSYNFCIDTHIFYTILNVSTETQSINIYSNDTDCLNIDILSSNGNNFNKFFKIPLLDIEHENLDVPDTDYNAEFSISSKKICEIFGQMLVFGTDINIKCSEETIDLIASGLIGEMKVNIPIDDLTEFSINEGETLDLSYSLTYISKMCLTTKLSDDISFHISDDYPMKIKYDLGKGSSLIYYIAPKIKD